MADKKPAAKPAPKPASAEGQMVFAAFLFILIFLIVIPTVLMFFGFTGNYNGVTNNFADRASSFFSKFVDTVGLISIFISLLFVMAMIYAKTRHKEISDAYAAHLKAKDEIGKPRPLQSSLAGNPAATASAAPATAASSSAPSAAAPSSTIYAQASSPAQASAASQAPQTATTSSGVRLSPFEQYMVTAGKPLAPEHASAVASQAAALSEQPSASLPAASASPAASAPGASSIQHAQQAAPAAPAVTNPRWIQIERNMQSHNMSEWRIAILEADILLFDMLSQMGYEGNSIGEILKNVDKANFVTLDDAWKAHRIRNIIAHEGANYELSRDEAERTIRLFKRVFDEFYFI